MTHEEAKKMGAPHYAEYDGGIFYIKLSFWGFCYAVSGRIIPDYELKDLDIKLLQQWFFISYK